MRRCGRTVAGKQEQARDLISNRVAEVTKSHLDPADDSAGDKGGNRHTTGWDR